METSMQNAVSTATTPAEEDRRDQEPSTDNTGADLTEGGDLATIVTVGEAADFATAITMAIGSDDERVVDLAARLLAGGKAVESALRREQKSRDAIYRGLVQVRAAADSAYETPEVLVATAKAAGLKPTKASWASAYLMPLKLALPQLPAKIASDYAKALNYTTAAGIEDDKLEAFIREHGIVALAREETKRQRAKKGTPQKPPQDPVELLQGEQTPVELSTTLKPDEMPKEGQLALLVMSMREGAPVAWGIDTDEKAVAAAARRLLKRIRAMNPVDN